MKKGGKVIFNTVSDLMKDELLVGGFLEAINSFYRLALHDNIHNLEGQKYRINFLNNEQYQFIGISYMNINLEKALSELEYFAERFTNQFQDTELENSENDVRVFKCFSSEIGKT